MGREGGKPQLLAFNPDEAVFQQWTITSGAHLFAYMEHAVWIDTDQVGLVGGVVQSRHRDPVSNRSFAAQRIGNDVRCLEQPRER